MMRDANMSEAGVERMSQTPTSATIVAVICWYAAAMNGYAAMSAMPQTMFQIRPMVKHEPMNSRPFVLPSLMTRSVVANSLVAVRSVATPRAAAHAPKSSSISRKPSTAWSTSDRALLTTVAAVIQVTPLVTALPSGATVLGSATSPGWPVSGSAGDRGGASAHISVCAVVFVEVFGWSVNCHRTLRGPKFVPPESRRRGRVFWGRIFPVHTIAACVTGPLLSRSHRTIWRELPLASCCFSGFIDRGR